MVSLNCYPKIFTPNRATVILYPRFNTRYMKDALAYRGSVLWNCVSFNEHGVPQIKQKELIQRLRTKYYFKDFKFNVASASTVQHGDDNFIYMLFECFQTCKSCIYSSSL